MSVIIVSFPIGAGGKCVINCLGLSNSATIMDCELAYSSTEQKSDYFKFQFAETLRASCWNDLGLKSTKFMGLSLDSESESFTPSELSQGSAQGPGLREAHRAVTRGRLAVLADWRRQTGQRRPVIHRQRGDLSDTPVPVFGHDQVQALRQFRVPMQQDHRIRIGLELTGLA